MCGIFGIVAPGPISGPDVRLLGMHARQRGKDSSGMLYRTASGYEVMRCDMDIKRLLRKTPDSLSAVAIGHSRLITNGLADNQPVVRDGVCVFHNGIVVNDDEIWGELDIDRQLQIDTEVIAAIAIQHFNDGGSIEKLPGRVLDACRGVVACAIALPRQGKVVLFSNNGSLFSGKRGSTTYFASEKYPLEQLECAHIAQIEREGLVLDIPVAAEIGVTDESRERRDLIPQFRDIAAEEATLVYPQPDLQRCTQCILPSTMPFIAFDNGGVCNYCHNYKPRNNPKPKEELFALVEPYRRTSGPECIVPFSGGRDSCYGLHLIVNELKMRPITYTYDWGMVNDLGRRNVSRMSAELGVENIIVAADITAKRRNIALNLRAWLKHPDLGMVSILTAGDKHFFRHVETVKRQAGVSLNLWGVNPLEVTHFKAGFLGVPPDFEEKRVYTHGLAKQLRYQRLRFGAMRKSPGYFNRSIPDTLSGEYYRSFTEKSDYFHIFDYWSWDEHTVDATLDSYDWERAIDTNATWRIGDGTAAFYNYIYYTVAGFTEHDTFRSNQIREGQLTRDEALELVADENRPRYQNIRWYLDAIGMDFRDVIEVINRIPRLYQDG